MEHVTVEYRVAVEKDQDQMAMHKAEFRIGSDGKVSELRIAMESGMPDP